MRFCLSYAALALALLSVARPAVSHAQAPVLDSSFLEAQGAAARNYARMQQMDNIAAASHRPWVWLAEKGNAKIWVAGCLHMGADPDPCAFPSYLPYYDRAAMVYFEVMPDSWQNPDVITMMGRRGYASDRRPLSGLVSPGTWQEVCTVLQQDSPLFSRVRGMEPWLAALTISQEGYRRAGLQRDFGLECYLERRARSDRKPVGALEKAQDQIYAMADSKRADQERTLQGSLENYGRRDFGSSGLRRAWRSGDEKTLRDAFGNAAEDDEMHFNLLPKRNQNWVKKIDAIAGAGRPALVVVGVEHLISEPQSLVSLLRAAGYKVQRVGTGGEVRQSEAAAAVHIGQPKTLAQGK